MTEKRFRKGKSILTDFPTGAIVDKKTGEKYYDGIKPSYISSEELVKILNELHEENQDLHKKEVELGQNYLRLLEENEQLKEQLRDCEKFRHTVFKEISKEMSKHD